MRRGLSDVAIQRLFIAPTRLLLIAMNAFPLFWSLYLSFIEYNALDPDASPRRTGGANFAAVLGHAQYRRYSVQTAAPALACVGTEFALGLRPSRPLFRGRLSYSAARSRLRE